MDGGTLPAFGNNLKLVHEPARTDNSQPHARARVIPSLKNLRQIADTLPLIGDFDDEELWRYLPFNEELHFAAARVGERITGDFRNRR